MNKGRLTSRPLQLVSDLVIELVGEYSQLVYYDSLKVAFAYDPKIQFLIKVSCIENLVNLQTMINPTFNNNQALVKDPKEQLLFVNTEPHTITAYRDLSSDSLKQSFKITQISGDQIIDSKVISPGKLLTLSKDGHLDLYAYTQNSSNLLSKMNMNYGRIEKLRDYFSALGVGNVPSNYIVLSTESRKGRESLLKILLMKMEEDNSFLCLSKHLFKKAQPRTRVFDMRILVKNGMSLVVAFQSDSERKLIYLGIVEDRLCLIDEYENFHKNLFGSSEWKFGSLYAVEGTGTLRILDV